MAQGPFLNLVNTIKIKVFDFRETLGFLRKKGKKGTPAYAEAVSILAFIATLLNPKLKQMILTNHLHLLSYFCLEITFQYTRYIGVSPVQY